MAKNNIHKLFHWEYWPLIMFYIPNIPYALLHGIKEWNLVFYTAVNPGIKNSGIGSESKYNTLQKIPKEYVPKSVLHKAGESIKETISSIKTKGIIYPLIVKPDVGFRGLLVKKIHNEHTLKEYLNTYTIDIIIQEFLTHENECGIFYYRHPNEEKGQVTSITLKVFLHVIGDGFSNIESLILKDNRAKLYLNLIKENSSVNLKSIPKNNEKIKLSSIGNHSKGTQFINGCHLINKELSASFDNLNHQINGWYYGRMDVKYNSLEALYKGDFKILELNGILAEPTHIYDADKTSYFGALKIIRKHWKQLYKIAVYNHKQEKVPYRKIVPFIKEMLALKAYSNRLKKLANTK
ncbi:MAG: D-alanine--D-alanine ligase [Flavobacteriaceae bacterium]